MIIQQNIIIHNNQSNTSSTKLTSPGLQCLHHVEQHQLSDLLTWLHTHFPQSARVSSAHYTYFELLPFYVILQLQQLPSGQGQKLCFRLVVAGMVRDKGYDVCSAHGIYFFVVEKLGCTFFEQFSYYKSGVFTKY